MQAEKHAGWRKKSSGKQAKISESHKLDTVQTEQLVIYDGLNVNLAKIGSSTKKQD